MNDLLTRVWRLGRPLQWRFLWVVHSKFICGQQGRAARGHHRPRGPRGNRPRRHGRAAAESPQRFPVPDRGLLRGSPHRRTRRLDPGPEGNPRSMPIQAQRPTDGDAPKPTENSPADCDRRLAVVASHGGATRRPRFVQDRPNCPPRWGPAYGAVTRAGACGTGGIRVGAFQPSTAVGAPSRRRLAARSRRCRPARAGRGGGAAVPRSR
jgi:hypothetical protein